MDGKIEQFCVEGAISTAVALSIRADMRSCPLALAMLRDCNMYTTSSSEHKMLGLHCDAGLLHSCKGNGGSESLKQLEKNEFKMFALSSSEVKVRLL